MSIPGPQDITRRELGNGIVVLVRENHASPSVVVNGYLLVGACDESAAQAGLAGFTADALSRGTVHHTFDQIYARVESVGASFGINSGVHTTRFGGKSLAEDLPLLLEVIGDALRHPTFPVQEVEKLRGEILTDLEERAHDTGRMASLGFRALAYPPNHPYSRSTLGYTETISALTRDDLLAFYQRGYGPQGAVIVVVGGIDTAQALEQVDAALGDWSGTTFPRSPLPPAPPPQQTHRRYTPIPGKTQADLVLGVPGPPRTHPAFLDAVLGNTVLGVFGLMGRLGETVREEQGLAYYSYSRVEGGLGPGAWSVIAGVAPENVEQAVESIRAEIRRIGQEPIPTDELADSQAFLTGSLPLRLETNEGVAHAISDMELYGLGLDYLQRYSQLIRDITPAQVQAILQQYLNPDAYALSIAGPSLE